ncbi:MAG: nucleotidyltransferase domain-containing protein [Candidatus Coatesbacteria bacterium]
MALSPETYASDLTRIWGESLKSVVLYGSAASGDHHRDSDYNLLVVVATIDPARIRDAAKVTRGWTRGGNPPPLLMTPEFLANSADAYPLEWLDMLDHHRVLAGEDLVAGLAVNDQNLRLELERELKSAWLKLLGRYQAAAASPSEVRELMVRSSSTFLTLFRGCLRLLGVKPLPPRLNVAAALAERLGPDSGFDPGAFAFIHALREKDPKALKLDPHGPMDRYLAAIGAVIRRIDAWT